ncbi:polysaccharide biosynthesis tyrosine autokinase [Maridesulfovibrio bastinii]|uniref:polysaccharide biosynthesis tyrosine autokinase n=1 Tax=Maridesulfovibrio bastinii TaxID=47157 RepID=UPI00040EB445|nr:polysaccharide biosynthesis tyrosine autokinase [Maridesulfovibrio bastinii]
MSKLLKAVEKAKKNREINSQNAFSFNEGDTLKEKSDDNAIVTTVAAEDSDTTSEAGKSANISCSRPGQSCDLDLDVRCLTENRVLTSSSSPEFTDIYNLLRTQIFHRTKKNHHNVIMVTSAAQGEGKSLTALNLAISIARELDQFALLVDTDMRNPSLHKYLGMEMTRGLSDHLMKNVPVHELFIKPGLDKLTFLPAGEPIRGSTEILGSPKLQELIVEMKQRYPDRYVIFDCPDLLHAPDALVFSTYVDGIIFVVEAGKTSRENVMKALNLLEGRNIIGLVLNKANKENLEND